MPDQNLIKSAWSSRGRRENSTQNVSNIKTGKYKHYVCAQFICLSIQNTFSFTWLFSVIGFYAAYIWWFLRHQNLHQFSQTELELCGSLSREKKTSFFCKFMCLYVWVCVCVHLTVSGLLWSINSSAWKHWLTMWFPDWHSTCNEIQWV